MSCMVKRLKNGKGNKKCGFCGRSGHIESNCWDKNGRPNNRGRKTKMNDDDDDLSEAHHIF